MLSLAINFLTGRSVSSRYDYNEPEWPPDPARVFFALVSSFHENSVTSGHEALEWLERQAPPDVYASEGSQRDVVTAYVPVNSHENTKKRVFVEEGVPVQRIRQPRSFPTYLPDSPVVYMVWPHAYPHDAHFLALFKIASGVSYLGHSSSLVSLRFDTRYSSQSALRHYIPSDRGQIVMRTPSSGLLRELEEGYALRGEEKVVLPSDQTEYRLAVSPASDELPGAILGFESKFIVFRGIATPQPPINATFSVASAMRGALLNKSGSGALPERVSGHTIEGTRALRSHLAIVPLPDVGHRHADGELKGVAMLIPSDCSSDEKRTILKTIGSLGQIIRLRMGSAGVWVLTRDPLGGGLKSLSYDTWTSPSKTWATVTPIVLDNFPKRSRSPEDIIKKSCDRLGLPPPVSVTASSFSAFVGVPPAKDFVPYEKAGLPTRIHIHARLSFEKPLMGPILIGAGRFYGLGLLRPLGSMAPEGTLP